MSSSAFHLKPEEVDKFEKRRKYTLCVVGCGQIGVLHACLFAEAGFKVICADADQAIINNVTKGKIPFLTREVGLKLKNYAKAERLTVANDVKKAVSQSDVIIITVPVEIDEKKKTDYSKMENICKHVGSSLRRETLVIVISTVGVGTTEDLIKEVLENASGFKVGVDFGLAYSPTLVRSQSLETLLNQERIVAAMDKSSLSAAATILGIITKGDLKKMENVRMAEASILFAAIQRSVSTALANELAFFCEKADVDYPETQKIANNRELSAPLLPKLADEGTHETSHLLLEDAESLNLKLRFPAITMEVNEETLKHAVNLTKDALRNCGKPLRRARISLLGITEAPNEKSAPKKIVMKLARMLEARGAKVSLYDPYFSDDELVEMECPRSKNLTEALEGADCILIATGHEQFKRLNLKRLKVMTKTPVAIVDFTGIVEPDKVEKEGFIYRGLGRGVWRK